MPSGVIWHQLLTGDLTSPAPTGRRWVDELREQGTSDAALDLLSSCFESNPAHRPSDAVVLAEGLEAISRARAKKNGASVVAVPLVEAKHITCCRDSPGPNPVCNRSMQPRPIEPVIAPAATNSGASTHATAAASLRGAARRRRARLVRTVRDHHLRGDRQRHGQDHGNRRPDAGVDRRNATFESRTWASRSRFERARTTCW